jgi:hypothetical protein
LSCRQGAANAVCKHEREPPTHGAKRDWGAFDADEVDLVAGEEEQQAQPEAPEEFDELIGLRERSRAVAISEAESCPGGEARAVARVRLAGRWRPVSAGGIGD